MTAIVFSNIVCHPWTAGEKLWRHFVRVEQLFFQSSYVNEPVYMSFLCPQNLLNWDIMVAMRRVTSDNNKFATNFTLSQEIYCKLLLS